mgnify:CR=1 FL=1
MDEGKEARTLSKKKVLGKRKVISMSIFSKSTPLMPVHYTERKRQITAWSKLSDSRTQNYIQSYWDFQTAYKEAQIEIENNHDLLSPLNSWEASTYHT